MASLLYRCTVPALGDLHRGGKNERLGYEFEPDEWDHTRNLMEEFGWENQLIIEAEINYFKREGLQVCQQKMVMEGGEIFCFEDFCDLIEQKMRILT